MSWIKLTLWYLKEFLFENVIIKFIVWIWTGYMTAVYIWNEELFHIIVILFIIDWVLWTMKAIKHSLFTSHWFFRWIYKVLALSILLYLWYSLDTVLPYDFALSLMFAFIVITDVSSILENLEDIWVEVPSFLRRALSIHKHKIFTDQVRKITWYDISNKYLDDLNQLDVYINNIPNPVAKKLFKVKIIYLRRIISQLIDKEIHDIKTFKFQIDLLFKNVGWELERAIKGSWEAQECIDKFWESHSERFKQLVWEIDLIVNWYIDNEDISEEEYKQIKDNILQTIIRVVYRNISDKFKEPKDCTKLCNITKN